MKRFSKWFPAWKVNPVHVGWYQVKGAFIDGTLVMRYWDGRTWFWMLDGSLSYASVSSTHFKDQWRGLNH